MERDVYGCSEVVGCEGGNMRVIQEAVSKINDSLETFRGELFLGYCNEDLISALKNLLACAKVTE